MRFLLSISALLTSMWGCTAGGLGSSPPPADPAWALFYVIDDSVLCFDPPDASSALPIFQSSERIILPRCSPDGESIAFYAFAGRTGSLVVAKLSGNDSLVTAVSEGRTVAEIEAPLGDRTAVFPPVWDGERLLVVDHGGIHGIGMDRSHDVISTTQGIVGVTISADGTRIAYSNGVEISITDGSGKLLERFQTTTVSQWQTSDLRPLTFSPDGTRLAYGVGNTVYVLDLQSGKRREIMRMVNRVFWIQWLAGERLLFVTGKTVRNIRLSAETNPYAKAGGSYELWTMRTDGDDLDMLFEDWETDAHLAQPVVSPDGRFVALEADDHGTPLVVVIATGGGKAVPIMRGARSDQASWLPMPGSHAVTVGLSRTVVYYPLE